MVRSLHLPKRALSLYLNMTLIYQSFRNHNVPRWVQQCMESVEVWTKNEGYSYRFIDDELFEYAPDWYRHKVKDNVQLVSDLSRLVLAKRFLSEGYDRVIWIDADLLIFDPVHFSLETEEGVHFCREIWTDADLDGKVIHQKKINNSVCIFPTGHVFLDFYIDACLKLVAERDDIPHVLVGTTFLTALIEIYPFSEITNVGIISPSLVFDLLTENTGFLSKYLEWHAAPVFAANLCGSMQHQVFKGLRIDHARMLAVVQKLLQQQKLL